MLILDVFVLEKSHRTFALTAPAEMIGLVESLANEIRDPGGRNRRREPVDSGVRCQPLKEENLMCHKPSSNVKNSP